MLKNLLFFLCSLPMLLIGQNNSGIVEYKQVVKIQIELPEEVKAMAIELPTEDVSEKVLLFSTDQTLFKNKETEEEPETIEGGGGDFQFKMVRATPDEQVFTDLGTGQLTEMKEFFGKNFLINDEKTSFSWKITAEQKAILGFPCIKATYSDTSRNIVAWFAPTIPVSSGPNDLNGLPGLILEADIDDGKRSITATNIEITSLEEDLIKAPSKGKQVTREEYDAIVEAKMKEMEEEMGGQGGAVRVIRRN